MGEVSWEIKIGKSSQNCPILVGPTDIWGSYIMCILFMLLKVVSHYELMVLFMSVMGLPKKFG